MKIDEKAAEEIRMFLKEDEVISAEEEAEWARGIAELYQGGLRKWQTKKPIR